MLLKCDDNYSRLCSKVALTQQDQKKIVMWNAAQEVARNINKNGYVDIPLNDPERCKLDEAISRPVNRIGRTLKMDVLEEATGKGA